MRLLLLRFLIVSDVPSKRGTLAEPPIVSSHSVLQSDGIFDGGTGSGPGGPGMGRSGSSWGCFVRRTRISMRRLPAPKWMSLPTV